MRRSFMVSVLAAVAIQLGCQTQSGRSLSSFVDISEIPPPTNCQSGSKTIVCTKFDDGRGSETAQPIADKGLNFAWIGDLAKLYEYYEIQLGKEFEKDHAFKNLSFELQQILVVVDEQSTKAGRKVLISKMEKDGDGYIVYVDKWAPKTKGSGCKSFSKAITRPYHMVQIDKKLSFYGDARPEIKLVATQKYYKSPDGQLLE